MAGASRAIKAAKIQVDFEAKSASFSEALERLQKNAKDANSGLVRSFGKMEAASKRFEKIVSDALWAPFRGFKAATAPFTIALRQIQNSVNNALRPFKNLAKYISGPFVRAFNRASSAVGGFGKLAKKAAIGAGIVVGGFMAMTVASVKTTLEVNKLSTKLGISFNELNALGYAAATVGVTTEQLGDSMKDLTAKIEDAAFAGSGALEPFFTRINQKASDWKKLSPTDQLLRFGEELSKMDYQTALYWADEVNDSMSDMAPLLHKGKEYFQQLREEAELFGSSIKGVDGLKELSNVFGRIQYTARNALAGIAATFAPMILAGFETGLARFKVYIKDNGGFENVVRSFSASILESTGGFLDSLQSMSETIKQAFNGLIKFYNSNPLVKDKVLLSSAVETPEMRATKGAIYNAQQANANVAPQLANIQKQEADLAAFKKQQEVQVASGYMGRTRGVLSHEDQAMYDEEKAYIQLQREQLQQTINATENVEKLQEHYQKQVAEANALATYNDSKPTDKMGDGLRSAASDIRSGKSTNTNDKTAEQKRAAAASETRKKAIAGYEEHLTAMLGKEYKGQELMLQAGTTTQQKMIDVVLASQDQKASIDDRYNKQKVLLEETSAFRIMSLEADKAYAVELGQEEQLAIIDKKIKAEEAARDTALEGANLKYQVEVEAYKQKNLEFTRLGISFEQNLKQLRADIYNEETNEKLTRYEDENNRIIDLYDQQLSAITDKYTMESDQYKEMLARKEEALAEHLDRKAELDEEDTVRDVQKYDNQLTRLGLWATEHDSTAESMAMTATGFSVKQIQDAKKSDGDKIGMAAATGQSMIEEQAKTNKKMFMANKAMKIADALMSTYKGAAAAWEWGMPMGPIFAAMITAQGLMNVNSIKNQQFVGQFHDGIDSLPSTGTYIGEQGERVVDKRTNKTLKQFLLNEQEGGNTRRGQTVEVNAPLTVNQIDVSEDQLFSRLEQHPDRLRRLMSRI
ncbi:hypothetical protein [Shewanella frigidimarina]|uniref:hypothetical protein n=1 Tax=Shewanella frigidimarina TaxID=56812 RepID=UPI003D7A9922